MQEYNGSCHCGAIKFQFTAPKVTLGVRCDCSLCRRKGAIMTPFVLPPEQLKADLDDENLSTYQFGTCTAKHHFCRNCGIYTFHQTRSFPGQFRINLGCVDDIDSTSLPVEFFPGADI